MGEQSAEGQEGYQGQPSPHKPRTRLVQGQVSPIGSIWEPKDAGEGFLHRAVHHSLWREEV